MECPKCGRQMTTAQLTIAGATFACLACLGCNHLFIPVNSIRQPAAETPGPKLLPAKSSSAPPASEYCHLSAEELAAVKRLLES